jgi:hypothetical protein
MARNKVVSIHKQGQDIEPPEGWQASTPFGHLTKNDEPFARVGEVLRWLEESHLWSRERALNFLLEKLPPDAICHIHRIEPGRDPVQVAMEDSFGFPTAQQLEKAKREYEAGSSSVEGLGSPEWRAEFAPGRRVISNGLNGGAQTRRPVQWPPSSTPGMPALRLLLSCWTESQRWVSRDRANVNTVDLLDWQANHIAVSMVKAFEWWGYGKHAGQASASDVRPAPAGELDGLPESLRQALLRAADERRQAKEAAKARGKSVDRVAYTSFQRVTMADAVDALNKLAPGSGRRVVAGVMGIRETALDDATAPNKLKEARAELLREQDASTGGILARNSPRRS